MGSFSGSGVTRGLRMAAALCVIVGTWSACGGAPADVAGVSTGERISEPAAAAGAAESLPRRDDFTQRARVVVLGDSLTAGLGLGPEDAYPARLQERVDGAGWPIEIVAMGVSGDTTAGGLRRLDWALDGDVRILVVALGGNDALRGLPIDQMRDNLERIIDRALDRGIGVVLAGMEAPPNFGAAYTSNFRDVFRTLAQSRDVTFVPFLLDGVAGVPDLNQADGIHPNEAGAARVAEHLWPALEPLLRELAAEQEVDP
ncbi:MAG: arylesterase [Acidobacteria bacterium]|nr:arylesterase [Acidobacteriota bacterium]MCY4637257.1 arylesterase [Acidobacteriota bacterium]